MQKMLIKAPQIKLFVRPLREEGENIVLACFLVARHENGFAEIVKTFYKTVLKSEYEKKGEEIFTAPTIFIAGAVLRNVCEIILNTFKKEVITFYRNLSFFISQPTRAPNKL